MTIRSRLLSLLLPTLILFVALISIFFFFNWQREITASFRANLRSIVVTTAQLLNPEEIAWINTHRNDPSLTNSELYKKNENLLKTLKEQLPIFNIYIVSIEPVKPGERILLDQPASETNKAYEGTSKENSYRQVYLIDSAAGQNQEKKKIYQDYSESDEHQVYYTKKPLVTPIYKGKGTHQEFMTGYAPILLDGSVIALAGADVNLDLLNRIINHAIFIMIASSLVTILLVIGAVIFIANKIAQPVSQLKNAALALAAGDYEEKISVHGPKEIAELSNTFNTMRECLLDYINRLRDTSSQREKLYGEQECALLLQNRMLDGVIDRFEDKRISVKHLTASLTPLMHGLKLTLTSSPDKASLVLQESIEEGFEGVYSLLNHPKDDLNALEMTLHFNQQIAEFRNQTMPRPLHWSTIQGKFAPDDDASIRFESGDFIFLFNQEVAVVFPHRQTVKDWISKVMRQFAKENLDLLSVMLTSELNFLMKKQHTPSNIHLFCIKVN